MDLNISQLGEANFPSPGKIEFVQDSDQIIFYQHKKEINQSPYAQLAGPRAKLFFDPAKTTIGIVTCGGLCPGLNMVIRSIVFSACNFYGVKRVLGFRSGYFGLNPDNNLPPLELTPEKVDTIHEQGGTILGSSRGPQEPSKMIEGLQKYDVNILCVIGGDGTMRGAQALVNELKRQKLAISVVGIPKTIDNDIAYIERSFGFETAVEEARKVITCAHVEAKGAPNGIGIVKLMGRESGFITAAATLASSVVNYCLVPEVKFSLTGPNGLLVNLEKRLAYKNHAVIVVAEGAGQELIPGEQGKDASGNTKLKDIGIFLKEKIQEYFRGKKEINVKYIDPSYLIRSVPANADDNVYCLMLGQNAVHAGMAGKTEVVIGYRNEHYLHFPMSLIASERKRLRPEGRLWRSVLETTNQPERMI